MEPQSPGSVIFLGVHPFVELLGRQEPERDGGFLQGRPVLVRLLRDLRGVVVADVRIERRHEHQAACRFSLDARAVRLDADRAEPIEVGARVGEQADALRARCG